MIAVDNIDCRHVWIVATHGHRIDSVWTSAQSARDRVKTLKERYGDSADMQVEMWIVSTNEVLR